VGTWPCQSLLLLKTVKDLEGMTIATELSKCYLKAFLASHKVDAEVEFSWGATEVKVPELVDAIVDLTETGSSLRANKLRIVDVLMETNTVLIANKKSWQIQEKSVLRLKHIAMMLDAALQADSKVGLKLNLERVSWMKLEDLPAFRNPPFHPLADDLG